MPYDDVADEAKLADRVDALVSQMTLREKVSLMSGKNSWQTMPIERLGIPSITMTDGPHGVRANRTPPERISGSATSFPTGVSMAASWDPGLVKRVGVALARETRALGCTILLGPCVNIARTPLAGRNFEAYSEDPYLAGRIGVAWVKGLQSQRVGASLKHYACNNQEVERHRGNSVVTERALREIYLPQFEAVVKEAKPWTVMCAYNRINGAHASENAYLQNQILRCEWGYQGVVVSDWGANHTTVASVKAGLDLEMPGPPKWFGRLLEEAIRVWRIEEATIDRAVRRIVRMVILSGLMGDGDIPPGAINTDEHQALARELAEASITLLKNDGAVLPLKSVAAVAVIGPNAAEARIGGGGSSYLEPPYRVSPLEGLLAALSDQGVQVRYAQGCANYGEIPELRPNLSMPGVHQTGFVGSYYDNNRLSGEPAATRIDPYLDDWNLRPPAGVDAAGFSARWEGRYKPVDDGRHLFKLRCAGSARLYLDGELILEIKSQPGIDEHPVATALAFANLGGGAAHDIAIEYVTPETVPLRELRVLCAFDPPPEEDDRLERAVELAETCDVALIFGGMPRSFESEGHDRPDMRLPGPQDALIEAVAATNAKTVVVLNAGSPVEMPWIDEVAAVLLAYYPGQEGGNALASILTGAVNPSGKLPVTLPRVYRDNPTYINYPGLREVVYGEGIFVGYRYYDKTGLQPLFPFGHGLSYTTFEYTDLTVPEEVRCSDEIAVSLTVSNTGQVAGQEVAQLYIVDKVAALERPPKELKGFRKVALGPGESTNVTFTLDKRALSFYDPVTGKWVAEPGEFEVLVGSSSRDVRARATFVLL